MLATRPFGRTLAALAIAATTTLAACSDSTGPTTSSIDANAAAAKVAPIAAVFEQSTLESMAFAGNYFAAAPGSGLRAVSRLTTALRGGRNDAGALVLARSAAVEVSAAVVPQEVKGSTYVYDAGVQGYVLDGAATGAPANGVRIVLYAWDALAGTPASPLNRIGYVDLIDQSTASGDALRVRVVRDQGAATLADYVISHAVNASGETFGITGSASNATTTVNFTLSGSVTGALGAEKLTAAYNVSIPALGYSVGMQISADEALQEISASLSIGYDGHTITFDETASETAAEMEVRYDGQLYATYTATYDPATGTSTERFVKANGAPLSQREIAELAALFERAFDLGSFWDALLWPAYAFE